MKNLTLKLSAIVCVFAFIFSASISSCKKDRLCHGKVIAHDTAGGPVSAAAVKLSAPSVGGQVTYNDVTDGSGIATFEVKLPAIFDVTVTKGGKTGTGVLRLDEPGKEAEVNITIK